MIIFYFTGTGNTKYVCDYLSEVMINKEPFAKSISITDITPEDVIKYIEENDIVFLAYPIYGSDMPENMKRFIKHMPDGNGKKLGVICTQNLFSGDGASIMKRELKSKGYNQKWAYQINMPNNLCIKGSPLPQSADYSHHENSHLKKARIKIEKIAKMVKDDKKRMGDSTVFHTLLGFSQRPAYRKFGRTSYAKSLDIDSKKCVKCLLCVDSCPNGVIVERAKGVFYENRKKCTVCVRCLDFCPQSAVTYKGSVKEPLYKGPTREIYSSLFKRK